MAKIDYTSRDFQSIKHDLVNRLKIVAPELTNTNESEFAIVMIDLFAYVGDILSYSLDRYANEAFLRTAVQRRSVINLCKLIGYKLSNQKAATVLLKFTLAAPHSEDIVIPVRTKCSTEGMNRIIFETNDIAIIPAGELSVTIEATQGETKEEVLGYSDGTANQSFILSNNNAIDNSIEIYVNSKLWTQVESLFNSNYLNEHYILEFFDNETIVKFGDGINGVIPEEDATIFSYYRIGGGEIGNVGPNTITSINNKIYDSANNELDISVINEEAATGGQERESIEQAKERAVMNLKSERAVTKNDYDNLASTFYSFNGAMEAGVSKRDDINPMLIHIYCWEKGEDGGVKLPNENIKDDLKDYLDKRSMVGITNEIHDGLIKTVNFSGNIFVDKRYTEIVVRKNIKNRLDSFFNSIKPGEVIPESLIDKEITSAEGVIYFDRTLPSGNIELLFNEMPKLGSIENILFNFR